MHRLSARGAGSQDAKQVVLGATASSGREKAFEVAEWMFALQTVELISQGFAQKTEIFDDVGRGVDLCEIRRFEPIRIVRVVKREKLMQRDQFTS